MAVHWVAFCQACKKEGVVMSNYGSTPVVPPSITGVCPDSPDGKHIPKWGKATAAITPDIK